MYFIILFFKHFFIFTNFSEQSFTAGKVFKCRGGFNHSFAWFVLRLWNKKLRTWNGKSAHRMVKAHVKWKYSFQIILQLECPYVNDLWWCYLGKVWKHFQRVETEYGGSKKSRPGPWWEQRGAGKLLRNK